MYALKVCGGMWPAWDAFHIPCSSPFLAHSECAPCASCSWLLQQALESYNYFSLSRCLTLYLTEEFGVSDYRAGEP